MKVLMITNCDILSTNNIGVFNKLYGQAKAFVSQNCNLDFYYNKSYMLVKENINNYKKIFIRPKNSEDKYEIILNEIKRTKYNIIYIRYSVSDYYLLKFLYNVKLVSSDAKIILDFPTYPYDNELKNSSIKLSVDRKLRLELYKYVDLGICYNNVNKIFSIPVINIGNGVSVNKIKIKDKNINKINNDLRLIAVANISFWHGFDRIINELNKYYSSNPNYIVNLTIVGDGDELNNLVQLVKKNNLQKYVKFKGAQKGTNLDKLFNESDIAIGSLGMKRNNLKDGSTLKLREYCSRGIPFIYGYNDNDFNEKFKYALKVPNDESYIDIKSLINFYESIKNDEFIIENMREYAEQNLSWENKVKKILELIK
ncbi:MULTISPECIES: glycosyltransferase [unclassified Clostridium]|uniref:glycosyltransferase n=1 Tax=unclassified Clostridium TaxID=2614128 RepID=UPI001D84BE30|nr:MULTISPECIES: glycosyltransferase [unclassified Clostridium]MBN1044496.1 glycosyltransferase family 1 protein [Clostridium botulinum]